MVNIIQNLTKINKESRKGQSIQYIVIHYTGNKTDTAKANSNYFKDSNKGASAHYFVDKTSIYQSVSDSDAAWSIGKNFGSNNLFGKITNYNSISIEMCSDAGAIAEKTFNNTVDLTKSLMKKYNIPASNIYRHYDICSKLCPGWKGWLPGDESLWNKFKNSLTTDYSLVFDANYYSNNYADLKKAYGIDSAKLLEHFINCGMKEGRRASYRFDIGFYKSKNTDLQKAFGNNLPSYYLHYIENGHKEGRYGANYAIYEGKDYSLVYDEKFYLSKYTDLQKAIGDNPEALIKHFVTSGMKEGRQAISTFNVKEYKAMYSDLQKAFGNNLPSYYNHYINHGNAEKRKGVK